MRAETRKKNRRSAAFRLLLALFAVIFGFLGVSCAMYVPLYAVPLLALTVILAFVAVFAPRLKRAIPRIYKCVSRVIVVGLCAVVLVFTVASIQILTRYFDDTDIPSGSTVLVLGCGLSPDDHMTPSLMLSGRLRAAMRYLDANPDARVIVSGGQGANELQPEGDAMRDWLTAHGVDASRIFVERESTTTAENIAFSKVVTAANGLPFDDVVIATDGFHEFRAQHIARGQGITPYTVSSRNAPLSLTVFFWVREVAGVVVQVWIGN
ncbi:MAG: YdcF family protein [Oscillospiraceae bacterium]|jgi:uncharacterized SAM-binding protein YcdF (DUF218 family)|nr:YdcF family protein [Oscillospiraceae bacterium]